MPDQSLNRPCGGIAQGADGVALDLFGEVPQLVDFLGLRLMDINSARNHFFHKKAILASGKFEKSPQPDNHMFQ